MKSVEKSGEDVEKPRTVGTGEKKFRRVGKR